MNINNWIRQPTTLHGLGVIAAGAGAALSQVTTGNHTVDAVIGALAYVAVHLGVDDHSAAEASAQAFVTDLVHGAAPVKMLTDAAGAAAALPAADAAKPAAA